ncbi:helix-turn-helix domain-containing protein [Photobacterium damselae subsp. piscicida]|uniref:Helix-turn-helix domain protein n=2 Tax=Photobacterium damselae TaxID=38293 RepID=A0A1Q9GXW7_PHODP|nr:helix-turn-helix domain-containing protein [Photobacterium damselae]MBE8129996.1 helix-turn-helix domain-containing protein [Photobacterium damselae subsp. piscicida]MDP2533387.1 helix-turn-helix domain-containing protein [Photobacterium damselae subsp. piscicida]MDP2543534.1 helix-turn-helix domain-containing protein [Photobacterium damselae subsp. piscicida]OLQ80044.1 transcriptional regulator [Photobacterium damselae subsp. piscicida]PSV67949.1 transcriptional regulator [Photobacterium d
MEYLERIKRLAKIQGISQKQLGEALGLQQGTMSRKLSGKYGIEVRELETIATTLNTSIGYILTGQVDTGTQATTTITNESATGSTCTYIPVIHRKDFTSYASGDTVDVVSKRAIPQHLDREECLGLLVDNENIAQCAPVGSYALATKTAQYRPKQPVFASVRGSEPDFYHMTQLADGVVFSTSQPDFPNLFVNNGEFEVHGYIIQSDWAHDR